MVMGENTEIKNNELLLTLIETSFLSISLSWFCSLYILF